MAMHLIKDHISRDTVTALSELHQAALSGHITGLAFVATLKRNRYITNVAGVCFDNPSLARGLVCALDDELSGLVHGRHEDETR